jgi:DNA-binding MurR/RpiR family transcriptional regulator
LRAGDVVVGIGYSGYSADVAAAMRVAHNRGATTIGITGSDVSAVARSADITLICTATSPLHLPSDVAASAVVEGLTQALTQEREEIFHQNMDALDKTYAEVIDVRAHPVASIEESIMRLY